jgi:SAM-dependent methyltransferase
MSDALAAADWATTRGEKWAAQLDGMEGMLAPVNGPLIEALRLDAEPRRIADLGCGGGGATAAIAKRAPAGSTVHGYDISPVLIDRARLRVPAGAAVEFRVADLATATPTAAYDRLASRFGMMFFDDPEAAFQNLTRWLVPGGRFAFAVWGAPSLNPWMKLVKDTVAELIEVPAVDPNGPGPFRYADVAKLVALLQDAGFADVETHEWRGKLPLGGGMTAEDAAKFALEGFSSLADWIKTSQDREALTKATEILTERFSTAIENGVVRLDAYVHLVTGASYFQTR